MKDLLFLENALVNGIGPSIFLFLSLLCFGFGLTSRWHILFEIKQALRDHHLQVGGVTIIPSANNDFWK